MKAKIVVDLDRAKLLGGLEPRVLHRPLAVAEDDAAKAEREIERLRAELADHERRMAELPARVERGEAKASSLAQAHHDRGAAALMIAPAERALAKARERVSIEERNASSAVQREIGRRAEQLERIASEVAPVLAELRELSMALARMANPLAVGGFTSVSWPCDAVCDADRRQTAMASSPAPVSLAWSGNKS